MGRRHRLEDQAFTCANSRFQTNTRKPFPHGEGVAGGSVFEKPLAKTEQGDSLWLEHVLAKDGAEAFWLMWYDQDGNPTIPLSGVMSADEVREMSSRLARFMELP